MRRFAIGLAIGLSLAACSGAAESAKAIVREELVDGDSARFENVVVNSDTGRVCGWVNAKNRLGGYTGSDPFLVANGRVITLGSRIDPGAEGAFGACVASNKAASERLMRDVHRAVDNYAAAVRAQ